MKNNLWIRRFLVSLVIAWMLSSCDMLSPIVILPTSTLPAPFTPAPTLPPTPTPKPGDVVYSDRFDGTGATWTVGVEGGGIYEYKDGGYSIRASENSIMEWGTPGMDFQNLLIEVDATPVEAPENQNTAYGVMCRVQSNGDGYSFRVSSDGYYAIHLINNDEFSALVDWTESPKVNLGLKMNHIKASCNGDSLEMQVNGTKVASVTDGTFSSGDIGLTATSYEDEDFEVSFDNVKVRIPPNHP